MRPLPHGRTSVDKALVVDGSEEIRNIVSLILSDADYDVKTAGDSLDGLNLAKNFQPDLILIDLSFPEMKGLHLLLKMREVCPNSHIGVLIANPGDPAVQKIRGVPGTSLVVKGPGVISFLKTLQACSQRPGKASAAVQEESSILPKILVVDDEESIRTVLRRFLEKKGYQVKTASNGIEALKVIESEKPVLVLLDVKMPGMDGLQLLDKVKKLAPATAVMMITGNTDEDVAKECMKRGAFDYIGKPLNFDYLENSVMAKIVLLTT